LGVVLGLKLRASWLLGRCSTTWATPPAHGTVLNPLTALLAPFHSSGKLSGNVASFEATFELRVYLKNVKAHSVPILQAIYPVLFPCLVLVSSPH
jgi:hypothetical protein